MSADITRWTAENPCPVCTGHPRLPQGQGVRCYGFLSSDRRYAHCTREEHAGSIEIHRVGVTFAHRLDGDCLCGGSHEPDGPIREQPTVRPPSIRGPSPWTIPDDHIEMVHDYIHDGELAFQVCRVWPCYRAAHRGAKALPRFRGEDGRWYFGQGRWKGRCDKPLYRQREALEELLLGGQVYLVEGERDADALWETGNIAVCNPDGAGSFNSHHAKLLAAAMCAPFVEGVEDPGHSELIVLADADDVGLRHARKAAALILEMAPGLEQQIRVQRPPAGFKDIAEWLTQRGER